MSDYRDIESIAVIGMAGRFPGADNISQFWENLCDGKNSISFFDSEELVTKGADPELISDDSFVGARGVLSDVELFDEKFFGFTAREAEITDPQHRVFLECCWHTFEDAGYIPENIEGSVGVFAGSSLNTYLLRQIFSNSKTSAEFVQGFQAEGYPVLIGNDKDYIATRVAHKLNLRGPALTIQTACSTSLVAVVQACQSLLSYQCDTALAGGVSITFPQQRGYLYQEGALASADGYCRAFDAEATGTVFGSGCGVVMLKRLSEAQEDRDHIYAVIKGAAINNDGSDKVSFSAPSVNGQAEVIALAQALAGVNADTIHYVEAHGTGTPLGDPIEVAALSQAFSATTDRKNFCGLGSVKTNVGHLEAAAGVTGLIKACLAVSYGHIPPSLHFRQPNPHIDFESSPFYVVTDLQDWPAADHPRRAGVSSFGMGGTNAHVVLEQAPGGFTAGVKQPQLLPVSAQTLSSLQSYCADLAEKLRYAGNGSGPESFDMANIAFTLQTGRRSFTYRHAIVAQNSDEAATLLSDFSQKDEESALPIDGEPLPAFLFPGQGAQRINMCRVLYENNDLFRETVDTCCKVVVPKLGFDLRNLVYPKKGDEREASRKLMATANAQPALFVIGYSVAILLQSWGIRPGLLAGHSVGEFVAAVLGGVMSLEDGLNLVVERGRLMQAMPEGAMISVRLTDTEVMPYIDQGLAIAAINGMKNTVVSGPLDDIDMLEKTLSKSGIGCRRLQTSHAFHSPMMREAANAFRKHLEKVSLNPATVDIVSTKTGRQIEPLEWASPEYWFQQILEPVRFFEAGEVILRNPHVTAIDIGPGQILANLLRQNPHKKTGQRILSAIPLLEEGEEYPDLLKTLGMLWAAGSSVDWRALHKAAKPSKVSLPTYSFDKKRHWVESGVPGKVMPKGEKQRGLDTDSELYDMLKMVGGGEGDVENVILQQLQIMFRQLQVLQNKKSDE